MLQVALTLILLVGPGLLLQSFARLRGVDPGFRVENVLTATVGLPADRYSEAEQRIQFFEEFKERFEESSRDVIVLVQGDGLFPPLGLSLIKALTDKLDQDMADPPIRP